ncbi:ATP phosphoribosyltransferase [Hyphobacterium marinum]|uniref:ATP phosphoribosyltransferase n=1 Tax=Hyphobacterium marinum TaxID=3116574 RepID=A0ABU7LYV6_9PROT|nr:ATP phosphoribosyltransferase [Hyphobacterium sp. Y6023]MEE2566742.1 ATP phosphoribosyltransferase [Hyphobacterium sp. Y6023]
MSEARLNLAVQKSGRLAEGGMSLLKRAGLRFGYGRDALHRRAENMPLDLLLLRDDDIPSFVAGGACDYGIVGENVLYEAQARSERYGGLEVVLRLGFAGCTLKLAAPKDGSVRGVEDLEGRAVATSYPGLTRRYLEERGIIAEIVEMRGSVEVAPRLGIADAICDLVSTGATLEANGLAAFETVLESEAVLIRRRNGRNGPVAEVAATLIQRAEGVIASAQTKYILLNAPTAKLPDIKALLPGSDAPTVAAVAGRDDVVAVHAVCREQVFWETLEKLKAAGARAILVLPIEKMMA